MKLLEYQAKALLHDFGIPTARGCVIDATHRVDHEIRAADLRYPLVVKAQVQAGGRGKAGGILFAHDQREARELCEKLLGASIQGHEVHRLLIVEKLEYETEWYLSIMLDRLTKSPMIIFSAQGGVEIEQTAHDDPQAIRKIIIDPLQGIGAHTARYLQSSCNLPASSLDRLDAILRRLYEAFLASDALLMEINPLVLDRHGELTALDSKVEIDDSALCRQPKVSAFRDEIPEDALVREARTYNFLYIPIDTQGVIGVISNGSGMLMSSIDVITSEGLKVGSALDLGGGATADRICEALRMMFSAPGIKGALINIFGGITRCDEVANGVKQAVEKCHLGDRLLIIRMEGTNKDRGIEIIRSIEGNIRLVDGLRECLPVLAEARESL